LKKNLPVQNKWEKSTMNTEKTYDLVIIGGGPGGLTAGIYAMRAALDTVLIEKGITGGQMNNTDIVENWPGTENITGAELAEKFLNHAQSYGLEVMTEDVAAVEPGLEFHSVKLANGTSITTHAVILAVGGSPRKLGITGEDTYYGKGVSYCAVCDGFFYKNKTVVVVGGGDTAAEEALYLVKIASKVYLVHRRDELRASMILHQRIKAEERIEVLWDTVATEIKANEQGVNEVLLRNLKQNTDKTLSTDGIFIFIGFEPNNQLVPAGVKKNADGYVVADEKCMTNIDGIFAIGDLREKYAKQIVTAAADGCNAALVAAYYVENKKA
jgi:thioredoxin reductase (NADPH)